MCHEQINLYAWKDVRDRCIYRFWLFAVDRATRVAFSIRGQSLKQMSRAFATPVGTIKRRLHVARNRLEKQRERAAAESAGAVAARDRPRRRPRELACV